MIMTVKFIASTSWPGTQSNPTRLRRQLQILIASCRRHTFPEDLRESTTAGWRRWSVSRVTSFRLSDELERQLDELAIAVDRSRAWLIEQAIARYVEEEAWQIAAVSEALAEYRAGGATLHVHDDAMARLEARIRAAAGDADPLV